MSDSITFRGAILKHFDVRQGKEGGDVFCRIHISSDYSEQVQEKMEWEPIPESVTECKLTGSLLATNFILTPGDKQLRQFELNFDISSVEDFSVVAVRNDDGDICGRELRFVVRTPKDGVEGFVGNYIRRVGRHAGALKIRYSVQEELDLGTGESKPAADEETDEDTGCISCNNSLPFEDAGKTRHANGMECTRESGSSTLSSAREAAGGTHAKKRGRTRKEEPVPASEEQTEAAPVN